MPFAPFLRYSVHQIFGATSVTAVLGQELVDCKLSLFALPGILLRLAWEKRLLSIYPRSLDDRVFEFCLPQRRGIRFTSQQGSI